MEYVLEMLGQQGYNESKIKVELVNEKFEKSQSTPLIKAASLGCLETVKILIENYKADPTIANINGENCLIAAVIGRHVEVVKYLCSECCKPKG